MNRRDAARNLFNDTLTYSDITEGEILALIFLLNKYLKMHRKNYPGINMSLSRKLSIKKNTNGSIKECHLFVNGSYFQKRQAISFERSGWIGFSGWASSSNEKPFVDAFNEWITKTLNVIEIA